MKDTLLVPARYRGPAQSANGGWAAGGLAAALGPADGHPDGSSVQVTLRQPPPLDATMRLRPIASGLELTFGGAVVARAVCVEETIAPVEGVTWDVAAAADAAYPGHRFHPFPTCFSCGTERPDGLRIFPGEVPAAYDGRTRVAATWLPDDTVADDGTRYDGTRYDGTPRACVPATWSALDCIGGWAGDLNERLMVLGQMTAIIDDLPVIGEPHVLTAERRGSQGRKTYTASTLHDSDGRIVGRAQHVWIAVDPDLFNLPLHGEELPGASHSRAEL